MIVYRYPVLEVHKRVAFPPMRAFYKHLGRLSDTRLGFHHAVIRVTRFTPVANVSSFRRMAAGMWRSPRDPSIYGQMDVDATAALAFLARNPPG